MNKFEQLKKLQKNAYCKYSNFRVSSIVITDIGEFNGVNVENAAYGDTICAERVAITSAIAAGATKFLELHLLTDSDDCNVGTPCGACRQVISEFFSANEKIYVYDQNKAVKEFTIAQLLPYSFNIKK